MLVFLMEIQCTKEKNANWLAEQGLLKHKMVTKVKSHTETHIPILLAEIQNENSMKRSKSVRKETILC